MSSGEDPAGARGTIVAVKALGKIYRGNVRKGHADVVAVDHVDLTVSEGELVVLLGPSGCGKTTLLRCIAGLEKPDAGEIRIGERLVYASSRALDLPPEDRRIGMMFQSYALWPHMTVFQNVAYPLASLAGRDREGIRARVTDQLQRLGVAGLEHRYPGELSGGQQQRVALARALIGSPSVILFDEPLSNVDAKVRRRLRTELRDLKAQNRFAGVYVTHDQEEAMELADTLAVMEHGRIRQCATGREVYDRPASIYVADFVGEINRWPARIEQRLGASGARVDTPLGAFQVDAVPAAARAGDSGWLVIRPERVDLRHAADGAQPAPSPPGSGRRFTARVHDAIDVGARHEYRVRIGDSELTAWVTDARPAGPRPARGDAVDVILPSDSLRWLAS